MRRQEISTQHVAELSSADSGDYWWYAVRQAHVDQALKAQALRNPSYLDLGCGAGGVMQAVVSSLSPDRALGLDGTQEAVDIARSRGLDARYADLRQPLDLPFEPTVITCLDVLEHLEDPGLALRNLAQASRPDALLVVTVPAMPSLHSRWDDLCGHHRRYTRALLHDHLGQNGWAVERLRAIFGYCVPPAWVQRRILKRVQEMEFPPVSPVVNRLMTWAGHVERRLGSPSPWGTSLIATAQRV